MLGEAAVNSIVLPVVSWATWGREQSSMQPDVAFIEPLVRRRLSFLDRIALHLAHACAPQDRPAHLVFASRHGELARSAELLAQLAAGEPPSPMGFSLSVLNAAAGLYGIARKDRSPATALSAEEASFPLALVEAAAQAWSDPAASVVLAFADEPPPAVYQELVDTPRIAHGIGVRLDAAAPKLSVEMSWSDGEGEEEQEQAVAAFMSCVTAGARASWSGRGHTWRWAPHGNA